MENIDTIKYIDLMTTDFITYRINRDNILEFDSIIRNIPIDCSDIEDMDDNAIVPIVESLLIVVENINKIINYDNEEEFDLDKYNISQVEIHRKDGSIEMGYVNLTTNSYNKNEKHVLDNDRLYITIEENF